MPKKKPGRMTDLRQPTSAKEKKLAAAILEQIDDRGGCRVDIVAGWHDVEPAYVVRLLKKLKSSGHKLERIEDYQNGTWRSAGIYPTGHPPPSYPDVLAVLDAVRNVRPDLTAREWQRLVVGAGRVLARRKGMPYNVGEQRIIMGLEGSLSQKEIDQLMKFARFFSTPPGWAPFDPLVWEELTEETALQERASSARAAANNGMQGLNLLMALATLARSMPPR